MIILISGKQGSGKTTLAKNLVERLGAIHLKFADPLYEIHEAIRKVADKWQIPFDQKEGRLLQLLGTEWGRACKGENVWCDALFNKVSVLEDNNIIIIDDCRFKNEFYRFKDIAVTIRLVANENDRRKRADSFRDDTNHPSEIDLDDIPDEQFDLTIDTGIFQKDKTLLAVLTLLNELGMKK